MERQTIVGFYLFHIFVRVWQYFSLMKLSTIAFLLFIFFSEIFSFDGDLLIMVVVHRRCIVRYMKSVVTMLLFVELSFFLSFNYCASKGFFCNRDHFMLPNNVNFVIIFAQFKIISMGVNIYLSIFFSFRCLWNFSFTDWFCVYNLNVEIDACPCTIYSPVHNEFRHRALMNGSWEITI